jgi:hypothetical protein
LGFASQKSCRTIGNCTAKAGFNAETKEKSGFARHLRQKHKEEHRSLPTVGMCSTDDNGITTKIAKIPPAKRFGDDVRYGYALTEADWSLRTRDRPKMTAYVNGLKPGTTLPGQKRLGKVITAIDVAQTEKIDDLIGEGGLAKGVTGNGFGTQSASMYLAVALRHSPSLLHPCAMFLLHPYALLLSLYCPMRVLLLCNASLIPLCNASLIPLCNVSLA